MSKRYSINWEDGEIVSFEVDGVQYAQVDQIPDDEDRAEMRRLVAKSSGEESGLNSDQALDKAFEAEIRDLERQAKRFPKVIAGVFLALSFFMLAIGVISGARTGAALSKERTASGLVVDLVAQADEDGQTFYFPVVRFELPDGTQQQIQLPEGSSIPEQSKGEVVTILYDPERPTGSARIQSSASTALKWVMPAITTFLGVAFLAAALFAHWMFKPEQGEAEIGES